MRTTISISDFDIFMLQETKIQSINGDVVHSLRGCGEVKWMIKVSPGRSVGLIIMWKPGLFSLNFRFRCEGFVGLNFSLKGMSIYMGKPSSG